jgi:hypothetical protein
MVGRRDLLGGGVLGGLVGALSATNASAEPAAGGEASDQAIDRITSALNQLRTEVRNQHDFIDIAPLRDAQKVFLRANSKFPDFIEVGLDVWFAVHDWHVRWQQPLTLSRDSQGRYTMLLLATTVIMRTDAAANFIGIPYDSR